MNSGQTVVLPFRTARCRRGDRSQTTVLRAAREGVWLEEKLSAPALYPPRIPEGLVYSGNERRPWGRSERRDERGDRGAAIGPGGGASHRGDGPAHAEGRGEGDRR